MGDVTGKADLMNQKTVGENWHGTLEIKRFIKYIRDKFAKYSPRGINVFVDAIEAYLIGLII